eukprot:scaffold110288_cov66-Phaeocystis_antarctica.AAC.3
MLFRAWPATNGEAVRVEATGRCCGLGLGSRPGNDRGRRPSESPTHERRCAISRGGGRDGYEGELREERPPAEDDGDLRSTTLHFGSGREGKREQPPHLALSCAGSGLCERVRVSYVRRAMSAGVSNGRRV